MFETLASIVTAQLRTRGMHTERRAGLGTVAQTACAIALCTGRLLGRGLGQVQSSLTHECSCLRLLVSVETAQPGMQVMHTVGRAGLGTAVLMACLFAK